ncbi:hypothetical protein AB1Y20_004777 [Prymnesium parvum]|uniref:SAM-dependent MTase RsmB/NOP-type domain-containing protein n=1 Tax=Prymnesium parvum TaxID=97485 RepID=A0AB34IY16_PRYPA
MLSNADFRRLLRPATPPPPPPPPDPPSPPPAARKHAADFAVQQLAALVLRSSLLERTPVRASRQLSQSPPAARRAVFACATETLKSLPALRATLAAAKLELHDDLTAASPAAPPPPPLPPLSLACVLLHDLLVAPRWLDASQPAVRLLLDHHAALRQQWRLAAAAAPPPPLPAADDSFYLLFCRVNTLLTPVDAAVAALAADGWAEREPLGTAPSAATARLAHPFADGTRRAFCRDAMLPDVLAFPAGAPLRSSPLLADGRLVAQDRASCACAHALAPRRGAALIDACAAPGKKTCHLAALAGDGGHVAAFEADAARAARLAAALAAAGARAATPLHADFLRASPADARWARVEGMLVDPSCSGSGTAFAHSARAPAEFAPAQLALLLHGLRFPALRALVYSTCSTSAEENEDVVGKALAARPDWRLRRGVLPQWPRRGVPTAELRADDAAATLRFCAQRDLCLGFFIACFERVDPPAPCRAIKEKKRKRRPEASPRRRRREAAASLDGG